MVSLPETRTPSLMSTVVFGIVIAAAIYHERVCVIYHERVCVICHERVCVIYHERVCAWL